MAVAESFDLELVQRVIRESHGIILRAARKLNVPELTLRYWVRSSDQLRAAVSEGREHMVESLEDVVMDKAEGKREDGDLTACIFMLKSHCRERYSESRPEADVHGAIKQFVQHVMSPAQMEDQRQFPMAKAFPPLKPKHSDLPPDGEKAAIEAEHSYKPKKKK